MADLLPFTGCEKHNIRRAASCRTCFHIDQLEAELQDVVARRDRLNRDLADQRAIVERVSAERDAARHNLEHARQDLSAETAANVQLEAERNAARAELATTASLLASTRTQLEQRTLDLELARAVLPAPLPDGAWGNCATCAEMQPGRPCRASADAGGQTTCVNAYRPSPSRSEEARCQRTEPFDASNRCELAADHPGWHRAGQAGWAPDGFDATAPSPAEEPKPAPSRESKERCAECDSFNIAPKPEWPGRRFCGDCGDEFRPPASRGDVGQGKP